MDGLNQKLNEYKIPVGLFLVGGVMLIGGLFSSNLIQKEKSKENFPKESLITKSELSEIKVDVSGAVNSPGVFSLDKDLRIEDAVKKAGGFSENANKEYISKSLNLSQKITDGLKIYIPFNGEEGGTVAGVAVSGNVKSISLQGKVGINSADQLGLESLPGVGPATAKKIIDNRPYSSVEELMSKKAVSKSVYTKILELVDLN
jgi:competence protein ComEA